MLKPSGTFRCSTCRFFNDNCDVNRYKCARDLRNSPDWEPKDDMTTRPPLGVIPLRLHRQERAEALAGAIQWYAEVGGFRPCVTEWAEELVNLCKELEVK